MMKKEVGSKSFPIWLLGDSNPEQWQNKLDEPLDSRHPIRHNIWTSVLNVIQDRIFREHRSIAGGKFIQSHNYFCGKNGGNYFEFVGNHISDLLIRYCDQLPVWID